MNTDEQLTAKRFSELSQRADSRGIWVYSDFLNMNEQSILLNTVKTNIFLYGGYEDAERKTAVFGNSDDIGYDYSVPVDCIRIKPVNKKFSDDLTHRDFLGALMNLGIKRETLGDIIVCDNEAYLFCLETVSEYILNNLSQIKHTTVILSKTRELPENAKGKYEEKTIITASDRTDAVICGVFNISRSVCADMIKAKKVFINGVITENPSYKLKENDTVSLRGCGKFRFKGSCGETKKGRIKSIIEKFV